MRLWVIEEVGPVGISLHVPEFKQFPQAEDEDVLTDLRGGREGRSMVPLPELTEARMIRRN